MRDVFRPYRNPARRLYDAFQDEALKRPGRTIKEWTEAEVQRVWREARDYSQENGLPVLTLEQIRECERYACGHCDYGAKWSYKIEDLFRDAQKDLEEF